MSHLKDMPIPIKKISKTFSWSLILILFTMTSIIMFTYMRNVLIPEYHLLHSLFEGGCVLVSLMIFVVIIVLRSVNGSSIFQTFGVPFFGIGVLDLLHSLAVLGIPSSISIYSRQESISFWIAARSLECFTFAIFILNQKNLERFKLNNVLYGLGVFLFVGLSTWLIYFQRDLLPQFVDSQQNINSLKVWIEVFIMSQHILFAGILIHRQLKSTPDRRMKHLTTAALVFAIAGLCFSTYGLGDNLELFWGHVLKSVAYFYVFKATLQAELISPYHRLANLNSLVLKQTNSIRELQNQMLASERLGTIGLSVGSVIHDLNNMLQVVDLSTKKILELTSNVDPSDPIHTYSEHIIKSVSKTRDFQRLLLSRTQGKDFNEEKFLHPHTVITEFIPLAQALLNNNLQLEFEGDKNCVMKCSQAEFEQLLVNLLVNAREAITDYYGKIKITLTIKNLVSPQPSQNGEIPSGKYVQLSVLDSGVGMTPELISKIFKPSFSEKKMDHQNHRGGFGLGLFTVMEITKRCGGWIQVDSKLGFGTEFRVWFPYQAEP